MTALSRPFASQLPAILDAITQALQGGFATNPDVLVKDGQWVSNESEEQIMAVGWSGFVPGYEYPSRSMSEELFGAAASSRNSLQGLGPSQLEEFTITCASICRSGNTPGNVNNSAVRKTCYANVATAAQMLQAGGTHPAYLNGAAMQLTIGATNSLHEVADGRGILAIAVFTIEGTAFSQQ